MPVTGLHTGHVQRAGKRSAQEPGRPGCEGVAEPHGCRREYITAGARTKPIGTILKIRSKIGSSIKQGRHLDHPVSHRWNSQGHSLPLSFSMFTRRSEEHTSELQSLRHLVCRLLLEKKTN